PAEEVLGGSGGVVHGSGHDEPPASASFRQTLKPPTAPRKSPDWAERVHRTSNPCARFAKNASIITRETGAGDHPANQQNAAVFSQLSQYIQGDAPMNETTVTVVGTVCSEIRYGQSTDNNP